MVDWEPLLADLAARRASGATWVDLAAVVHDATGEVVDPSTVRKHVQSHTSDSLVDRAHQVITTDLGISIRDVAAWLGVSEATATTAVRTAHATRTGVYATTPRPSGRRYLDTDVVAAYRAAQSWLGLGADEPVSRSKYDTWHAAVTKQGQQRPSSQHIMRTYGSWGQAWETLGVPYREANRAYDGLDAHDVNVWLAHWLRDLAAESRRRGRMLPATSASYRLWRRTRPTAPSPEYLRTKGTWIHLVRAAGEVARTPGRLPAPKG